MGIRRTRFCDGKKDGAFSLELGQINDAAGADATRRRATHVSQLKTDSDPVLRGTVVFNSRRTRSCGVPCL